MSINVRPMPAKPTITVEEAIRDGTEGAWLQDNPWDATVELKRIGGKAEFDLTITTSGSSAADAKARLSSEVEKVCAALMDAVKASR